MPAAFPPTQAVLSYVQAAHYLGLPSVGALRNMVYRGSAPPSIAFGKRDRRFRVTDVDAWLDAKAHIGQVEATLHEPAAPRRRGRPTKAEAISRRAAASR